MVVLLRNETMGSVYQEKFEYPAKMKANNERNYHYIGKSESGRNG